MKVISLVVVIVIAIVDAKNISDVAEITTKINKHVGQASSSEEKEWMGLIFPKRALKFTLNTKSTIEKSFTTPINIRKTYKKPVFKIIPKIVKTKHKNYWKTATTRRSPMKYTKFTINPLTTLKILKNTMNPVRNLKKDRDIKKKHRVKKISKSIKNSNEDVSSEEILETSMANTKRNNETKHIKTLINRFHKLGSNINKDKYIEKTSKMKPTLTDFSSEEKEDRKEFIFVTPKKIKEYTVKVAEDSNESNEITTVVMEKELKSRKKRSVNVIEEENLGTTVSGFKFTGKIVSLSSDLAFRNINT